MCRAWQQRPLLFVASDTPQITQALDQSTAFDAEADFHTLISAR
jgi:hypothetical protein